MLIDGVDRKLRVIVIDDSRAMRSILRKNLMEVGCEVIAEAVHGADGLARLRELGPADLALVDWNMPEMDGLTFVSTVRQGQLAQQMRIVMVTTESEAERVAAALAAGADEYVTKPFTPEEITQAVHRFAVQGRTSAVEGESAAGADVQEADVVESGMAFGFHRGSRGLISLGAPCNAARLC